MLRDNLAGLIEPMINRAGGHPLRGHPKQGPTGGCSRSTELTIVVLKRSWRQNFHWKTGRWAEKAKCSSFEVTTAARDSRAVGTALHQSHRTIDPQCLKKSPPRRGGIYALTKNVPSPFRAEPTQFHSPIATRTAVSIPRRVKPWGPFLMVASRNSLNRAFASCTCHEPIPNPPCTSPLINELVI